MQIDPTHTTMLRLQYSRQLTRLYRQFQKKILPILTKIVINLNKKYSIDRRVKMKTIRTITDDVDRWLTRQGDEIIIQPSKPVTERNIRQAYRKGAHKALSQLTDAQITYLTPADWDAFLLLEDINFSRIKDATVTMQNAITYSTQRGILEGWGINKIAYEIRRNIKGNSNMGMHRAKTIARTEVINAYNVAAQNKYKQNGVKKYIWITSFDERTCEICSSLDGKIFSVGHGEVPPVHPNCRCSTSPIYEKR